MNSRKTQPLFLTLFCFFCSGLLSLNYEILWLRKLHSLMGSTSLATAAILSSFMGGLALGAWLAGKYLLNNNEPLRTYGLLELAIALFAFLSPLLFDSMESIYLLLNHSIQAQPWTTQLFRTLTAGLLLFLPTTAMGATLPLLVSALARQIDSEKPSGSAGLLYGLNTLGAVFGILLTGFVLLPLLGQAQSLKLTAWLNLALGGLLVCVPSKTAPVNPVRVAVAPQTTALPALPLAISALTGCTAMILETSWTRLLSQSLGSTTYAFSLMLATYLSALALGSLFLHKRAEQVSDKLPSLAGIVLSAAGLSTLLSQWLLNPSPSFYSHLISFLKPFLGSHSFPSHIISQASLAILMIFCPVFFLGALFPVLNSWCTRIGVSPAKASAGIYSANTLAGVIGSWLASFVLGPWLGFYTTLTIMALLLLGAGLLTLWLGKTVQIHHRIFSLLMVVTSCWLCIKLPPQEHRFHLLELYHSPHLIQELKKNPYFQAQFERFQTRYAKDGLSASVSVIQVDQTHILLTDGKADASSEVSVIPLALSHLPLLFLPQAEKMLIIGLGSGITAGAATLHPLKTIDVVEIEKEVVQAAQLFFQKPAHSALSDPRVKLEIEDAYTVLKNSTERYDVIVSQSSHPWRAGSARLFTCDFWQAGKKALRSGGIFVQWLGLRHMQPFHLSSVLKSFQTVYPESLLFIFESEIILLGSNTHLKYHPHQAQKVWKTVTQDLKRIQSNSPLSADDLLTGFQASADNVKKMGSAGQLITEDNGLLEFQLPFEMQTPNSINLKQSLNRQVSSLFEILDSSQLSEKEKTSWRIKSAQRMNKH